jgi:hypothetical protein
MSCYKSGSYRDPYLIHADRFSEISSLHEAKLAAWAFAIGEFSPSDDGPARRPAVRLHGLDRRLAERSADRSTFLATGGLEARPAWRRGAADRPAVLLQIVDTLIIQQTLMGNFPMRIRWHVHRYLLKQSMTFFQDEFAGRIATKLMQTALAVREVVMKLLDVFVNYVSSISSACWCSSAAPTGGWRCRSSSGWSSMSLLLRYFIPRIGKVSRSRPTRAR